MKERGFGQKVAFAVGMASYLVALSVLLLAGYFGYTRSTDDPVFASLAASVVFFIGTGVVLHVIGSVDLPSLRIDNHDR